LFISETTVKTHLLNICSTSTIEPPRSRKASTAGYSHPAALTVRPPFDATDEARGKPAARRTS
jgi:hypothetical protein